MQGNRLRAFLTTRLARALLACLMAAIVLPISSSAQAPWNCSLPSGSMGVPPEFARLGWCTCQDSDNDGFCDSWEIAGGIDLNGDGKLKEKDDLMLPGADPNRADIYLATDNTTDDPRARLKAFLVCDDSVRSRRTRFQREGARFVAHRHPFSDPNDHAGGRLLSPIALPIAKKSSDVMKSSVPIERRTAIFECLFFV